jgi:hypothetical protein
VLSPDESREALSRLFQRRQVADLEAIRTVLKTTSRMTVFRRLSALGYFTSYSHNGRYYTLAEVPEFDAEGLWRFQGVCFSRHGSLKATVEHLVQVSEAGRTHPELTVRLQVRVHNTLLELVRQERIGREVIDALYLYVSADSRAAAVQITQRRKLAGTGSAPVALPEGMKPALLIDVLLEVIRSAQTIVDPTTLCERLLARSVSVTLKQIEGVYRMYGLKKTAGLRSLHSQQ